MAHFEYASVHRENARSRKWERLHKRVERNRVNGEKDIKKEYSHLSFVK